MGKRVAVLYGQCLAQYDVQENKNGHFIARLIHYNGKKADTPPEEIDMYKEGRHWQDGSAEQDLVDDIGLAIEYDEYKPEQPIHHQRGAEQDRDAEREIRGGKP